MMSRLHAARLVVAMTAVGLVLSTCAGLPAADRSSSPSPQLTAATSAIGPGPWAGPATPASSPTPGGTVVSGSGAPSTSAPTGGHGFTAQRVGVGRLLLTTLAGPASGVTMRVWVWLPPQYDEPRYAHTTFPVLILFPGGDGVSYTQWFNFGQPELIASKSATGEVSPFIMVEPQLQMSEKLDTECTDLDGQPKVGTFMDTDVPTMVKASFRAIPDRSGWGVGGASSGAYCANRILFAHPEEFAAGVSLAGYFLIDTPLPAGRTPAARATSPQMIAAGPNPPDVWLRCWMGSSGAAETNTQRQYDDFIKVVKAPTHVDSRVLRGATHTWASFTAMLPDTFAFFTDHLAKPVG